MSYSVEYSVEASLLVGCPTCGAEPTYWCVTFRPTRREPGILTSCLHAARQQPYMAGWRDGCRAGGQAALNAAAQALRGEWTPTEGWKPTDPSTPTTYGAIIEWLELRARHAARNGPYATTETGLRRVMS